MTTIAKAEELVLDEKLRALRDQMGEASWQDRLKDAARRLQVLRAVDELVQSGWDTEAACARVAPECSACTVVTWRGRFAAKGLAGLIDRSGTVRLNHDDAVPRPMPTRQTNRPRSFVKWVGSKGGVLRDIIARIPETPGRYFEPMAGAGTVFFELAPRRAVLGDTNRELMLCYEAVRDDVEAVLEALGRHTNTQEHFHRVRALLPQELSLVDAAARFIFLNKTCFNGLYRVNRSGHFNVPYGRIGHANFRDAPMLRSASARLQGVTLKCGDFEETVAEAAAGDVVYLDPPYLVPSGQPIRYGPKRFTMDDQRRVAALFRDLDRRGCRVLLSNAAFEEVRDLFRGFHIEELKTNRPINRNTAERTGWSELLIRNYDDPPRLPAAPVKKRAGQLSLQLT